MACIGVAIIGALAAGNAGAAPSAWRASARRSDGVALSMGAAAARIRRYYSDSPFKIIKCKRLSHIKVRCTDSMEIGVEIDGVVMTTWTQGTDIAVLHNGRIAVRPGSLSIWV